MYKDLMQLHSNQKILIFEMLKRGINVELLNKDLELIKTTYQGHVELIYDRDSSIMPYSLSVLAGDKGITKKILNQNNISVPFGEVFSVNDEDYIIEASKIIGFPLTIKPVYGSHGYDVYLNLNSEEEILNALNKIKTKYGDNKPILIEEFFDAKEYRVFITVNGDYAVLHRDPAHIYGDGISTIEMLIKQENYKRMNPRVNAMCEIYVDEELNKYISKQGFDMNFIPAEGEKVYLRPNSNVAMGGTCIDKTDEVDLSVLEIGMQVLKAFPGLPYVGIDFMTKDISKKQDKDSYRIIEINTVPGVHMHYAPAIGESRNIASYMVDLIYPETKILEKSDNNEYQKSIRKV